MYRFPWYLTLVSTNHASSNPGQVGSYFRWQPATFDNPVCYSSKPSFLWSWASLQSTAKVNTDTVNQYIDCDYRTYQYHIYL